MQEVSVKDDLLRAGNVPHNPPPPPADHAEPSRIPTLKLIDTFSILVVLLSLLLDHVFRRVGSERRDHQGDTGTDADITCSPEGRHSRVITDRNYLQDTVGGIGIKIGTDRPHRRQRQGQHHRQREGR